MPRHLLDIRDLSTQELDDLMDRADDIIQSPKRYAECMHGKKLATLFYEPSTRTRLSFEARHAGIGRERAWFFIGGQLFCIQG